MSADLLEVVFNHDIGSATTDALSTRRNAADPALPPEWRRDFGPAQPSAACYVRDAIAGPLVLRARFARRDPDVRRVEVRARRAVVPDLPPFWLFLLGAAAPRDPAAAYWYRLAVALWLSGVIPASASPSNVLGDIEPAEVSFDASGLSGLVPLSLNGSLQNVPVGAYSVRWIWQCRHSPRDPWIDVAVTNHTIYLTLGPPTPPWTQGPFSPANLTLPWLEVLDVACRWAAGAQTLDECADRITRTVNALGRTVVQYDCVGPGSALLGSPHYTVVPGIFDCTAFLERLRGGVGNGWYVNCADCAAIVATFANVLGCDLWESKMGGVLPFPLNPTRAIGSSSWQSACAVGAYAVHEVAWKAQCREGDEVYDACVELDGDSDPTRPPHTPLLPINMPFAIPGAAGYRDRLVAPPGLALCQPLPLTRQRRIVI